jgi:ADP-ribosylglycohydrolase
MFVSAKSPPHAIDELDRAFATLAGLAIGDALGMPTQSLSREEVIQQFESILTTFHPSRLDHPFASGLEAGTVTDDTEQTLILAEEILASNGGFNARDYARRLIAWEQDVRQRGLFDLLGPSTKQALANVEAGMDLDETGRAGTTNGAAMRIAPVGILCSSRDVAAIVTRVVEVSAITHNTTVALSGAAAVAGVISAGLDGASLHHAVATALGAVRLVESTRVTTEGLLLSTELERAVELGKGLKGLALIAAITREIGTSLASEESVPAAFAVLVAHAGDGWTACRVAASLGGDTDTIAAMTGAMSGALGGRETFPSWAIEKVESANHLDLERIATGLVALRR